MFSPSPLKTFLCPFVLLLCCSLLKGQPVERTFESGDYLLTITNWSKKEGLPTWHITDMMEDKRGFLWLSSELGIIRFDGKNFVVYPDTFKGSHSRITSRLAEDINGNIWMFHLEDVCEIYVFDPLEHKVMPIESYLGHEMPLSQYTDHLNLFCLEDTICFFDPIGTGGRYSGKWEIINNDTTSASIKENHQRFYYPRRDSLFWIRDLDIRNDKSTVCLVDSVGEVQPTPWEFPNERYFFFLDKELNFYYYPVQFVRGPLVLDTLFRIDSEKITAFPPGRYPPIEMPNTIWRYEFEAFKVNQSGFGLIRNLDSNSFFHDGKKIFDDLDDILAKSFNAKIYESTFMDDDGSFWFSAPAGLFRMKVRKKIFKSYPNQEGLVHSVRGITSIGDSLLIINSYAGAYTLNLHNGNADPLPIEDRLYNLSFLKEGNSLWIGKHFVNLHRYDLVNQQLQIFPLETDSEKSEEIEYNYKGSDILRLNDSILWIASQYGVLEFNERSGLWHGDDLTRDTIINCWHQNEQGIWAGTNRGLMSFDLAGTRRFVDPILVDLTIFFIHESKDGFFWLASDQGLIHWHPSSKECQQYTLEDGLSDMNIHAVYEDNRGYLWLPSNYGLMQFRKKDGYIKAYFKEDGLPSSEFNFLSHHQREDGLLVLGGVNGIISFYPDSLDIAIPSPPKLQLREVYVYDRSTEAVYCQTAQALRDKLIVVKPDENRIKIQLIPHYLTEEEIVYQWRLPNEHAHWITLNEPELELNNPVYGSYPIEFRVFPLGDRERAIAKLSIDMRVLKPFYLRWWFIVVLILGVLLLVNQLFRMRQKQITLRNLELEKEVNNKTKELQKQLVTINQQAKELQLVDEMKSRFFINISHELKTPLSLILGPISSLIKQPLVGGFELGQLNRIKRNAKKMRQLTEEILDLARLEAGKLEVQTEVLDVARFVKRVFGAYTSLASYKGITYQLELSIPDNFSVALDATKVERILNNFITNALKFTGKRGKVTFKASLEDESFLFVVEDTGIGIAAEHLPKIFDRYYQAQHHSNPDTGGLGIGLAMSKELAELMGGSVGVNSVLDKGTQVFFKLPIDQEVSRSRQIIIKENIEPASQSTQIVFTPKKAQNQEQPCLLLVEDNEELLDYLEETLGSRFQIRSATNGLEALEVLKISPIDLIISDVMMPEMDGFELLKTVRSQPQKWGIPFILLTARTEQPDQLYGLRLGVDAYISKPFEPHELIARIQNLLENQQKRKAMYSSLGEDSLKQEKNASMLSFDEIWLVKLEKFLTEELDNSSLKINDLALEMNMSERSFRTKLKHCTGLKPNQYILQARLHQAYQLLDKKRYQTVAEVVYAVGLKSTAYFSKIFKEQFGLSPSEMLK